MFNVVIDYLPEDDEVAVVARTNVIGVRGNRCFVHRGRRGTDSCLVRKVPVAEDVVRYAVQLAAASALSRQEHPTSSTNGFPGAGLRAANT